MFPVTVELRNDRKNAVARFPSKVHGTEFEFELSLIRAHVRQNV